MYEADFTKIYVVEKFGEILYNKYEFIFKVRKTNWLHFFVFSATGASKKHLVSENRIKAVFKRTGVVLAGKECSPKIKDFRANGFPAKIKGVVV